MLLMGDSQTGRSISPFMLRYIKPHKSWLNYVGYDAEL